ncbi:uncharacterized protein I303_107094 [Kwoniella dejecticola CBS 10117]|uniref:Protein SYM1 n=1 Tax=Kwoniella dejecticola CBS 10117 TaxID=1296121 RepID=A0A1A5ZYR1_9TREE|nr:uncharacterized protein I303_06495 [Kwoniella dejecticola CBS 10117]OBR82937.1 hypothetical protein I303_06495 [Kwoniella dejecticola CBS 10117]
MTAIPRPSIFARIWTTYTTALRERPLRTKMIQSGVLYISADLVAQLGIEGKSIRRTLSGEEGDEVYDPIRTARLSIYGSTVFAPLAHYWLGSVERIVLSSKIKSLLAKLTLDICIWSPFVTFMFPTCLGLLEGKNVDEVRRKVAHGWFPTWQKAVCVFGPTQVINFSVVPPQHRLLTVQSVGLCWNIFLSWQNNRNNKLLALAHMNLEEARMHALAIQLDQPRQTGVGVELTEEEVRSKKEIEVAQQALLKAEQRKESIKTQGGEAGVGVKMAWS